MDWSKGRKELSYFSFIRVPVTVQVRKKYSATENVLLVIDAQVTDISPWANIHDIYRSQGTNVSVYPEGAIQYVGNLFDTLVSFDFDVVLAVGCGNILAKMSQYLS